MNTTYSSSQTSSFEIMSARYAIFPDDGIKSKNDTCEEIFSPIPAPKQTLVQVVRVPKHRNRLTIPNMIDEAIYEMSPHGKGLSLVAIKKYIKEEYSINVKYSARRIREYIKESVKNGRFIQNTGRGANGSFRLASNVRKLMTRKRKQIQLRNTKRLNLKKKVATRKRKADSVSHSLTQSKKLKQNVNSKA